MKNSNGSNNKIKKVIIGLVVLVIAGGAGLYFVAQSNVNYSQAELQEIALQQIPGEVTDVKTELEIEDLAIEYNFYIRDEENIMREITVSTKTGAITHIENGYDD